jgi:small GTP-binding protein
MIQRKICLLGANSVGKTSLIRQFVSRVFDEKYLTTIGVKIDKKTLNVNEQQVTLIIWDLSGEDDYGRLRTSYLRGAAGYLLVVDGTRPNSLDTALSIHERARNTLGDVPFVIAVNKADLEDRWTLPENSYTQLDRRYTVFKTSAKSGQNVESLFSSLTAQML